MSLLEVKSYLMEVRIATLGNLAKHFHSDPELMRDLLCHWVRKGCVRQFAKTPNCGDKCGLCGVLEYEVYEWLVPNYLTLS